MATNPRILVLPRLATNNIATSQIMIRIVSTLSGQFPQHSKGEVAERSVPYKLARRLQEEDRGKGACGYASYPGYPSWCLEIEGRERNEGAAYREHDVHRYTRPAAEQYLAQHRYWQRQHQDDRY
jgi:hypothetical protein